MVCKNIGIRKFEFVAISQFLSLKTPSILKQFVNELRYGISIGLCKLDYIFEITLPYVVSNQITLDVLKFYNLKDVFTIKSMKFCPRKL